jgi:hypothetical protein
MIDIQNNLEEWFYLKALQLSNMYLYRTCIFTLHMIYDAIALSETHCKYLQTQQ